MKKQLLQGLILSTALLAAPLESQAQLEKDFVHPPEATKPRCYWYWMDGSQTKEGITKDLEAMRNVGIGEAYIGIISDQSQLPPGKVKALTEPFWDTMTYAVREATRLGVDIGVFNSPGWSQSGGPWVKPGQAMRHLVMPELHLHGPQHFTGKFPQSDPAFQDLNVLAFPAPEGDADSIDSLGAKVTREPSKITLELSKVITARSLTVKPSKPINTAAKLEVSDDGKTFHSVRDFVIDRHNSAINVGPSPFAPVVVDFPETTGRIFRISLSSASDLGEIVLSRAARVDSVAEKSLEKVFQDPLPPFDFYSWPTQPEPNQAACVVAPKTVTDLSKDLSSDGSLTWDVPTGDWIVLRVGMVPTGTRNGPAPAEATGLEVDKMNRTALKSHFDAYIGQLVTRLTPEERKSWKHVVADSYEMGPENWTDGFAAEFKARYGYDPIPYLPVMTGRIVGGADQANRFLWDLRRLVADRVAMDYVGGLRDLCHEKGLKMWLENYGHWGFPSEFLLYGGNCDEVSGEYWESGSLGSVELRDASSAAHIYGKKEVFAESWTGGPAFISTPWSLKKRGDWALCQGINQFLFHVFIQQPSDTKPGVSAWFGTEFNRNNTWFGMSQSWIDYLRRCSFLLQQGVHVADVAYFIGEDAPKMTGSRRPELPAGYDYDYINADVLLHRAEMKNGRLTMPDGMSFSVLVLPPSETMRPETLEKIKSFVDKGLTVFGPLPTHSPSLQDFPACDARVKELSAQLKGHVQQGDNLIATLATTAGAPDLAGLDAAKFLFIHRQTAEADIYFISNQEDGPAQINPSFRVTGKIPELWNPETGTMEAAAYQAVGNTSTCVPLRLEARGSIFVVFRKGSDKTYTVKTTKNLEIRRGIYEAVDGSGSMDVTKQLSALIDEGGLVLTVNNGAFGNDPAFQHPKQLRVDYIKVGKATSVTIPEDQPLYLCSGEALNEPWKVNFESRKAIFTNLISWSDRSEPEIKYYSGEATYNTHFQATNAGSGPILLDLGRVESLAEVTLNGHTFPILWKPPYRLDISSALQTGTNNLAVKVVNVWHNRLLAEKRGITNLGGAKVSASIMPNWGSNEPLLPAGLIGPVTVIQGAK